ncbi:MAG TPA: choice-of-anchor D domain-containing protein [Bryobacteraceae bacterium]|nr:choice-of-anchor D domain-containing protein [Bryobacteraceae bacterium]
MSRAHFNLLSTALLLAATSAAQTPTIPFSLRVQQGTTVTNAADGAVIAFQAEAIGRPADATVNVTHLGVLQASNNTFVGTATITALDISGSTDFQVVGPEVNQTFTPNQTFTLSIRYRPTTSLRVTGAVKISYSEQLPTPPNGVAPKPTTGSFTLNFSGVAPEFTFAYLPPPNGNTTPLNPNETIVFPVTNVNDTPTATVVITNKGSGPGVVNSIAVAGGAFTAGSLPPALATVEGGKDLRFAVKYSPLVIETSRGTVRIEFVDRTVTFNVLGSSQGPVFTYSVIQSSGAAAVLGGDTITLPDTPLATPTSVVVQVQNTGNADGRIASIDVNGAGFTLTELPFAPLTLIAGSSITFTVNFNPTAPGRVSGRLRIGADIFTVTGNGLGQTLIYAYVAGGVTTPVQNNSSVVFTPSAVGQVSTLTFQITNNGTAPGSVNSISVNQNQGAGAPPVSASSVSIFSVSRLPALPSSIGPGETVAFAVTFTPQSIGNVNGVLRIDGQTFPVSGVGNPPAAMADYRFTGVSGAQAPLQQVATGLTLASPYPLNLTGVLTLTFTSDVFSNDPAVQFASGGRTVNFSIPAGTTQAVFPNNSTTMSLQTGTVAGTITLTPSFVTDGGINLTPATPPSQNLTIPQSAPRLLSVQVSAHTASSLTLLITGYATSRSITQIDVQFTPVSGETVSTTKLTLPVDASFTAWYQSAASQAFGSQFTVTLPFNFSGDVTNVTNVSDTIQSVSVTLTNRQGVSSSQSVNLR